MQGIEHAARVDVHGSTVLTPPEAKPSDPPTQHIATAIPNDHALRLRAVHSGAFRCAAVVPDAARPCFIVMASTWPFAVALLEIRFFQSFKFI